MFVERWLCALVSLTVAGGAAGGCSSSTSEDDAPPPDGTPAISYVPFTSMTWSLATMSGTSQLSISDQPGAAACALGSDQHHSLGAAGVQIILHLPDPTTETCPQGNYTLMKCAAQLGTDAYVPAGCAFYRQFDAQGNVLGIAPGIDGVVSIAGTASSCAIRATVGFVGASFTEMFALANGDAAQPWCGSN
jgi:hypothetical protein